MIRVFLLDDHALARAGFRSILEHAGDLAVVGDCGTGEEALAMLPEAQADILLCDLYLPGMSGVEVAERILRTLPRTRVIALSAQAEGPLPRRMLDAGAHGYLCKGSPVSELLAAIRTVHAGGRFISTTVARHLAMKSLASASDSPFDTLSARELQVMLLFLRDRRCDDIARRLFISRKTVSSHKTNALRKLGVEDLSAAMRLAIQYSVIEPTTY